MPKVTLVVLFMLLNIQSVWATKRFVYCSEGSPTIFNPQLATDGATNNATHAIYNRLLEFRPGSTQLMPGLAVGWDISKDQKQFTFTLRQGVHFHQNKHFTPKRTMNADDVIFSFNRQRLAKHPYHTVGGKRYEYFYSMGLDQVIQDIQKLDDYRVRFVLAKPDGTFLSNLAMTFASILSKEYADTLTKQDRKSAMDTDPIGTGPFVFQSYIKGHSIEYKAFDKYFEGKAKIETLLFMIHPDAQVRAQKVISGDCHMISEPAPGQLQRFQKDPNLKVMKVEGMNVGYLAFNTQKKPFDQLKVRQAIYHALNRKSYIEAVFQGLAVVAKNPIPPLMMGYHKDIYDYEYNPLKAKQLLAQAGYKDGFTTELWALPVSRSYNPDGKKMAELMQSDLASVGIRAKIVTYDWPTYLAKVKSGAHTMCQLGWIGDNGDPDNFLYTLLACDGIALGSNVARWCNKAFNKLVWDAKIMTDPVARSKKYHQAQEIFKDQAPWVPIAHAQSFRVMQKSVVGYKISPVNRDVFTHVDLK